MSPPSSRRTFLALLGAAALASCGFRPRGEQNLPFETLYISGGSDAFAVELRRAIEAGSGTRVVDDPKKAQAQLQILNVLQDRVILSLSGAGRVRELELRYQISYRVVDPKGAVLQPQRAIALKRDMTYDDSLVLAKQQEEVLLFQDMQNDAIQQMLRQMALSRRLG
ncbi:MAG TPA: LPS assembly lipoprotein LptE [Pelomicrobium sp.]|nr:LPS assembly lipoprotein LptE [Pelomicrobium sp.]